MNAKALKKILPEVGYKSSAAGPTLYSTPFTLAMAFFALLAIFIKSSKSAGFVRVKPQGTSNICEYECKVR